jgi:hypothetical protein
MDQYFEFLKKDAQFINTSRVFKNCVNCNMALTLQMRTSGLYYKRVTIVIDTPSVVKVTLQIVASLTIVIDDALAKAKLASSITFIVLASFTIIKICL